MKIKEKGLTGKAADLRRDTMSFRKFNAFRLSDKDQAALNRDDKDKDKDKPPTEVYLEYLGAKLLIQRDAEGKGFLDAEKIPYVEGATLRFGGAGESLTWEEIKVCLCLKTRLFSHLFSHTGTNKRSLRRTCAVH